MSAMVTQARERLARAPRALRGRDLARIGLMTLGLGVSGATLAAPHCDVEEMRYTVTGRNFDPSQTHAPGGPSRPVSADRAVVRWWPGRGVAELQWELRTQYPFPTEFSYMEQLAPDGGQITGRDGFRSGEGAMTPARRAARHTGLWLRAPLLWSGESAGRSREISLAGTRWTLSVARDESLGPSGSVPLVAEARVQDPPRAPITARVVYSGWQEHEGVSMPTVIEQRLDGRLLRRERISDIALRVPADAEAECQRPQRPESAQAPPWLRGYWHWVQRRLAMGAGADNDQTDNVTLEPLAEGVFHVVGGSHHALLVRSEAGLSLVDAPLNPGRSETLLRQLQARWPDTPLRRVIVTHHHNDHSAGLRPLLRSGAELIVGREAEAFFREAIAGARQLEDVRLRAITGRESIDAEGRRLTLLNIPNDHAAGMLAVRVDDAALTFVADLYSPGREAQNPLLARQFYDALVWHGLASGELVGAHGSGTEPVSALAERLGEALPDWMVPSPSPAASPSD